ncbi:alpha/beta fold hydrolase [Celeribacter halophilus]|uniref:Pimeloyl-ACP methyl ester carboxylesterase n=1 Tax=Celeribacter halophilus TaxID=576117 RepID=A0A1I3X1G0_9RHOB|nr:alpha/beta hydrolase [Celeribacter halophilus]PZX04727.1 pimeloyl-ACP methyl ester carboxylesterase [Celeribacter halophilus]SFK13578.1 Pimeloyl-ACP methyl ester carboxylesterase [Celeribacter halophilus]
MTSSSQFIQVVTSVLKKDALALPSEEALLLQPQDEALSARFFYRNFSGCRLPANLFDQQGKRQVHNVAAESGDDFPPVIRMPEQSASGCAFVVEEARLYFLYDRMERWADAPDHVALVAVRLDPERIAALAMQGEAARLAPSEYLLLGHLLTGLDLKSAAATLGASYDTKRKQIQIILDKLGAKTQTALLRALSLEITGAVLDEILPQQTQSRETALIKRQFGRDVIAHNIAIGDGPDIPVWEFGARRGQPVLYFHSMLAPTVFHDEMVNLLKAHDLRWVIVPRHFLELDGRGDIQARLHRLTDALAETVDYLFDAPLICVAESAGVPWAVHFAKQNPDLVSRLVLAATPQVSHPVEPTDNSTIFVEMSQRLRRDERIITGLTQIYNAFSRVPALAQKGLAHMYRKSPADSACLDSLFQKPHLAEWLRLIANHATFASIDELKNLQRDWLSDLKATSCETLFFHGEEDPISPIEDIQAIAENLPEARFHIVENAGHLVLSQHFGSLLAQMLEADASQPIAN